MRISSHLREQDATESQLKRKENDRTPDQEPFNVTHKKSPLRNRLLFIFLPLATFLSGCQSLELSETELTWQALHVMDVAQTLSAARDPCYEEDAWLTRRLIGAQPETGEVLLWGVGTSLAHAWISNTLEDRGAPRWLQKTWSYATITSSGFAVASNHAEGVRVFGSNRSVEGCYL